MKKINIHLELEIPKRPSTLSMTVRYQRPGLSRHLPFRSESVGVVIDRIGTIGRPTIIETEDTIILGLRADTCPAVYHDIPVLARVKDPVRTRERLQVAVNEFRETVNRREQSWK